MGEGGTVERTARRTAVVKPLPGQDPAFLFLAGDIGGAGLVLGVEPVRVRLQRVGVVRVVLPVLRSSGYPSP